MRASLDVDDPRYKGRKSSRADFFDADEEQRVENDKEAEILEPEGTSDNDTSASSDDASASSEEDYGSDADAMEQPGDSSYQEDDEAARLEREMDEIHQAEEEAAKEMRERAAKEMRKSKSVKAQKKMWNAGLEARIMMQKVLQGANRLPSPEVTRSIKLVDVDLAQDMHSLATDTNLAIADIVTVLHSLADQHPDTVSHDNNKRKRVRIDELSSIDSIWAILDGHYSAFASFRDTSVDRWHRKTMLSSGNIAKSNLKVLNQNVSKQVDLLMKDREKIAQRSELPRSQFRGLCQCMVRCNLEKHNQHWGVSVTRLIVTKKQAYLLIFQRCLSVLRDGRGVGSFTYDVEIWKF